MEVIKEDLLKPYIELKKILINHIIDLYNKNIDLSIEDSKEVELFKINFIRGGMEVIEYKLRILEKINKEIEGIKNNVSQDNS